MNKNIIDIETTGFELDINNIKNEELRNALWQLTNPDVAIGIDYQECFDLLCKACLDAERYYNLKTPAIPKWTAIYDGDDIWAFDALLCPNCKRDLDEDIRYNQALTCCPYCGQSLYTKEIIFTEYRKMRYLTVNEIVNKCKSCYDCSKCEIKELCNIEFCNLNREILNKKMRVKND